MTKKIAFLGTGGTIAGRATSVMDNVGYRAGAVPLSEILASVPGLVEALNGRELIADQVAQLDSKDMDLASWAKLATCASAYLSDSTVEGLVVTHGTDTIEETAYFLSRVLSPDLLARKPLVMTCAMRPASSLYADGPSNLLDAVAVASCRGARGVHVVCAGTIHSAQHVQKVHTYKLDPFESVDAAPVGLVEEGRVRLVGGWEIGLVHTDRPQYCVDPWPEVFPRVEILFSHAGASGHLVHALLTQSEAAPPLRGLVVAGTGNGTIHQQLEFALRVAAKQGINVVRVSRCAHGQVVQPRERGDSAFRAMDLSAVKARIELMLELASQ